jgi:hypothetical protein
MKTDFLSATQNFIAENPMKIYPFMFIAGDTAWGSYGLIGDASPLWAAGAAIGIGCNALKIAYGKGGETALQTPKDKYFGESFLSFLKSTTSFTMGLFQSSYWKDLATSLKNIEPKALSKKFKNAVSAPHKYPLDAGWIAIAASGACYSLDALNVFGLRETMGNPLEIAVSFNILAASSIGFLTNRNDLAGRLFSAGSLTTIPMAISTAHVGVCLSIPLYLMGQYLMGRVIPANQSEHTIAENKKLSENNNARLLHKKYQRVCKPDSVI